MYQSRNRISNGALESIREFLASRNRPVTVDEVANIYPDLVTWACEKNARSQTWDWRPEARKWAHDHLQHLNRRMNRVVRTDGEVWHLASVNV
jgi:hypothetical protein